MEPNVETQIRWEKIVLRNDYLAQHQNMTRYKCTMTMFWHNIIMNVAYVGNDWRT